ncbi:MAG: thermonuclease family protein [Elusimicrobiota bacterium]|jgi:micrococcal nuclease|nr:thermonuclease family protein [Elusimicrobiota bacterium]
MKKKLMLILVTFLFCAATVFAQRYQAIYVSVIDGDTIKVFFEGSTQTVRLLNVDTPESKNNAKARRDAKKSKEDVKQIVIEGKKARDYTAQLLNGRTYIELEFDIEKHDRYKRLLAYVWLDKDTMLNQKLLQENFAVPMVYAPNTKYSNIFGPATYNVKKSTSSKKITRKQKAIELKKAS